MSSAASIILEIYMISFQSIRFIIPFYLTHAGKIIHFQSKNEIWF